MLYIVTAVHNRYNITKNFVENLKSQTYKEFKLVLVDDGSTDGTDKMVKDNLPDSIILYGNGNLWWGGALHMCYKWFKNNKEISDEDFIMFANDDTDFDVDYIEKAMELLKTKEKILLTGYGISKQRNVQVDGAVNFSFPELVSNIVQGEQATGNCASTRSLFFRVKDFKKIGGFHPILLPHYGSDYEWTIRATRKYRYQVYCDKNVSYSVNEDTTGYHSLKEQSLKKLMSKRSVSNPIYKMTFILLTSPLKCMLQSFKTQLKRSLRKLRK